MKVGTKDAYEASKEQYEKYQDDDRIQALGVPKVLENAKEAFLVSTYNMAAADSWKGEEWECKREACEKAMVTFQEQFDVLLDYRASITTISLRVRKVNDNVLRKIRTVRKEFEGLMTDRKCPENFAAMVAAKLEPLKKRGCRN